MLDAHWGGPVAVSILLCLSVSGAGGLCLVGEITAHLVLFPILPLGSSSTLAVPKQCCSIKKTPLLVKQVERTVL